MRLPHRLIAGLGTLLIATLCAGAAAQAQAPAAGSRNAAVSSLTGCAVALAARVGAQSALKRAAARLLHIAARRGRPRDI